MNRYYFCPFEPMMLGSRQVYAARVMRYLNGEAHRAYRAQPARAYCLAVIENPLPETQAAIDADGTIRTLPFTSEQLDTPLSALSANAIDTLRSWFTERNIPHAWATGSTTLGDLLRFVVNLHQLCQMTGVNFLQGDLALSYKDFPIAQRNAFRAAVDAYLAQQGRTVDWAALGLTNNTPLGDVLTAVTNALEIPADL